MNTNGNLYTVIYTTIVVVLVAAILAFASLKLAPKQEENVKADAISQMLTAAKFFEKSELEAMGNARIIEEYKNSIKASILVDGNGKECGTLDMDKQEIYTTSQLKAQNTLIKNGRTEELALPVFVFEKDGNTVNVVPCYGAGLWGPIWGYLAFNEDMKTIRGAYFDHASETPGLGAKIKDDPSFRKEFEGKSADFSGDEIFSVVKGGAPAGKTNAVDAITGASITSKALGVSINNWLKAYKPYFTAAGSAAGEKVTEPAADSLSVVPAADSTALAN